MCDSSFGVGSDIANEATGSMFGDSIISNIHYTNALAPESSWFTPRND